MSDKKHSAKHQLRLKRLSRLSGLANLIIGISVMFAWGFGWDRLKSLSDHFPPMTPNTAVSIILLGLVLSTAKVQAAERKRDPAILLVGAILLSFGVLSILEHVNPGLHLWPNHFLIELLVPSYSSLPGRIVGFPAVNTSVCLIFLGSSLLLFWFRAKLAPVFLIPSTFVIIYSLIRQTFHLAIYIGGFGEMTHAAMAPHTALALFLSIVGLLAAAPRSRLVSKLLSQSPSGDVFRIFSLFSLVIPIILLFSSLVVEEFSLDKADYVYSSMFLSIVAGFLAATFFAMRALDASEGRFFELMEQAGDGIFLADVEANITDVNSAACELLGYESADSLIGKNALDILAPDSGSRLESVRFELLQPGAIHRGEWNVVHKSGKIVPVDVCSLILPDGTWQTTVRDITARRKLDEQIQFLSHSSRVLAESLRYEDRAQKISELLVPAIADYCVVFTGADGGLTLSALTHAVPSQNALLSRLATKYPSEMASLIGQPSPENSDIRLYESVTEETYHAFAKDAEHLDLMRRLATRSYISAPLVARNKVIGALSLGITQGTRSFLAEDAAFFRQITSRFAMALDNARLYQESKDAIRVREDVLSIVSHDLKNPIAAADMAIQLANMKLASGQIPASAREYIDLLRRSIRRMRLLVDMMLNYGQLQSGTFQVRKREMGFESLFLEAEEIFRPLAKKGDIKLEFNFDPAAKFYGDFDALFQALSNLISNALKFSPSGSRVSVAGVIGLDGAVEIRVEDRGPGISAEQQSKLFERYWRPDKSKQDGAGLGLYIVRGVARAHGGDAYVESEPGKGSRFSIRFRAGTEASGELQSAG